MITLEAPDRAEVLRYLGGADAQPDERLNALLDSTEELVAEQVRQMLAGNVEARPRDVHSCDFCPVMQCEKRMAR